MKGKNPKITDSEWQIMNVLWSKYPTTTTEIIDSIKPLTGWSSTTVYTLISRLSEKGIIEIDNSISPHICIPKVTQKECRRQETKSLLNKLYNGSAKMLMASLLQDEELSPSEIDEIKALLNKNLKDGGKE